LIGKFGHPGGSSKLYSNFHKEKYLLMFILNQQHSIANQFLLELRDRSIQQDRMRFRKNMERLGEILAYEVSKALPFLPKETTTPLGKLSIAVLEEQPLLITILRAGLPFFQGFINFFDQANCGFIGAFRQEEKATVTIKLEYVATTTVSDKTVILIDPMLATGRSLLDSVEAILKSGKPQHLHIVSLVAAPEGIDYLEKNLKIPFTLWTCAVDEKLNHHYYIVPGLGDAGDLSYGMKI
jgi:uracil phosphoribosyltransferase